MEIPSVPTDNLYKFKAIGGIVLVLAGLYLSFRVAHDFNASLDRLIATETAVVSGQKSNRISWLAAVPSSRWDRSGWKAHETSVFSKTETDKICRHV